MLNYIIALIPNPLWFEHLFLSLSLFTITPYLRPAPGGNVSRHLTSKIPPVPGGPVLLLLLLCSPPPPQQKPTQPKSKKPNTKQRTKRRSAHELRNLFQYSYSRGWYPWKSTSASGRKASKLSWVSSFLLLLLFSRCCCCCWPCFRRS